MLGCTAPLTSATPQHRSHTVPALPARDRCPKALLNPETDEYDPQIAAAIVMHIDADAYGWSPGTGGILSQSAPLVAALRIVRATFGRMQMIAMKAKTKGVSGG